MDQKLRQALMICASKERQDLRGILITEWKYIASDTTVFVSVDKPFDFERRVEDAEGNLLHTPYPNVEDFVIFPENTDEIGKYSIMDLRWAAISIPESPDEDYKRIALNLGGVCIYPPRLLRVLGVFEALGSQEIILKACNDRLILESFGVKAVIMSLGKRDVSHPKIENYTMESLKLMIDLL